MRQTSDFPNPAEGLVAYNTAEYCQQAPPFYHEPQAGHRMAPHYGLAGQGGHIRSHMQPSPGGAAPESCTPPCRQVMAPHCGTAGAHNRFSVADPCGGDMMTGLVAGHQPMGAYPGMNTMGPQMSPQAANFPPGYHGGGSMPGTQCMPSPMAPPDCRASGYPVSFGQAGPMEASRTPYGNPHAQGYVGHLCGAYNSPLDNTNGYERQVFRPPPAMPQGQVFPEYRAAHYRDYPPPIEDHLPPGCEGRLQDQGHLIPKTEPEARPDVEMQDAPPMKLPRKRGRNSDKRKEQSRNAARSRREKEGHLYNELASVLPLPSQSIQQLDKASIMRLAIADLEVRAVFETGLTKRIKGSGGSKLDQEMDEYHMKALDGFLLVVNTDGRVIYTSENIATFLGHPQEEVMGSSLYHYTNMVDHSEVEQLTSFKNPHQPRRAFLRLKCTLTSKGRSVNFKNATDKVVQVIGEVVGEKAEKAWLVALAIPVPHPSYIEFPLDKQTFLSKHSLDMKFIYVDANVTSFCGYESDELVGRSVYELHHALDTMLIQEAYKNLLNKGQVETSRYRFLARGGGYIWLVTQATLIHGPRENKPQYVVCLNYVVSGVESKDEILSEFQLMCSSSSSSNNNSDTNNNDNEREIASTSSTASPANVPVPVASPVVQGLPTPPYSPAPRTAAAQKVNESPNPRTSTAPLPPPPPVASTFKIFVPRTKDMNKGFLTFNNNDPHSTVLKDEPEDLTHLAPSGGDTCVPLPTLIPDLEEEDSCMPQDVPAFIPSLDDMLTLEYPLQVVNSDAAIRSPSEEKIDDQDLSPKYLYEENQIQGVKSANSLSGGRLLLNRSRCNTPSPDCSSVHSSGLGTPEPPKPLLSEAALSQPIKKQSPVPFGSSHPRTTTESLFMPLDESNSGGSSELFSKLDLKFENQNMDSDEFEMRAPYIPPSNELLLFLDPDDLFTGPESDIAISPKCLRDGKFSTTTDKEDSSLAQLLRDTDPSIAGNSPGRNIQLDHSPGVQRSQYQQNKFLDGGGNFVDPNKVLPGHFAGKDELDSIGNDSQLADPPPIPVQEPVEPPPPLLGTDSHHTSGQVKRGHSPLSSPTLHHKKLCPPKCQQPQLKFSERCQDGVNNHLQNQQNGGLRLLTPHTPIMQQLLISKDPITVRGGRSPAGGTSASRNLLTDKSHSVLRNLLDVTEDNSIVLKDAHGGSLTSSPTALRIPKDRMATMLLTSAGGKSGTSLSYPTLRLVTGGPTGLKQAFKLTSNSSNHSEGCGSRLGQRQDPFLLMSSDTIPTLLELTQQDYEVNAPANNSLLQGAELLMALDQSSEAALLDGK
ncbi:protein similar-like isoform X5 [Eriocheir sinensis]|nr:protein similar-like isoform X5 [Eriocheir sinensis]